ncbi:MAG TPA: NUDIX domain-containing protein [Acidimicrobiales bacterium]|nr:NUDIX domain-containing protein [Acidimicrobiales bacterium]
MPSRSSSHDSGCDWDPDLRRVVLESVDSHEPADAREARSRRRVLEALATLARPFDEDADPVHVTGSAVVAGRRGTVLHRHKRLHRWLQPGGHVEAGEPPWQAALREAREETGLALSHPGGEPRLLHVDVHHAAKGHEHLDLRYLLLAGDGEPAPADGESPHVRWFDWDEAEELADDALAGALSVAERQPEVISLRSASP